MVSLHFLVTCFRGLDVLIMVEFISEDLHYIAKKQVLYIFLVLKYSKVINASICIYLLLLSLNGNSVNKQFIQFRSSFGNLTDSH